MALPLSNDNRPSSQSMQVVWDSLPVNQQLSTVTLVCTASYLLTQVRSSGEAWLGVE